MQTNKDFTILSAGDYKSIPAGDNRNFKYRPVETTIITKMLIYTDGDIDDLDIQISKDKANLFSNDIYPAGIFKNEYVFLEPFTVASYEQIDIKIENKHNTNSSNVSVVLCGFRNSDTMTLENNIEKIIHFGSSRNISSNDITKETITIARNIFIHKLFFKADGGLNKDYYVQIQRNNKNIFDDYVNCQHLDLLDMNIENHLIYEMIYTPLQFRTGDIITVKIKNDTVSSFYGNLIMLGLEEMAG